MHAESAGGKYLTSYGGDGNTPDWLSLVEGAGPCMPGHVCDAIAFESVAAPEAAAVPQGGAGNSFMRLRCVLNGKFLVLMQPPGPHAWVFRCAGDGSASGDGGLGLFQLTMLPSGGVQFLSVTTKVAGGAQAHINVVNGKHVRGHGSAPHGGSPAGQGPTSALKLEWVTRAHIDAGNAATKEHKKKVGAADDVYDDQLKAAIEKLPPVPSGEKWVISYGLYGGNPKSVQKSDHSP
jgi:hypothetical protein